MVVPDNVPRHIIRQQVGRRAADGAQRLVHAPGQRAQLLGPTPGSPPGTATRPATPRTARSSARRSAARRPSPTAATSPARDPRPVTAAPARAPGLLHLRDRPPGGRSTAIAADQAVPVRSNTSKISMISLPNLVTGPSGHRWVRRITSNPSTPEGPPASRRRTPAENRPPARTANGHRAGETMTANPELTGRTPVFSWRLAGCVPVVSVLFPEPGRAPPGLGPGPGRAVRAVR